MGRPPRLSRDSITSTALAVVDGAGAAALTMRRLAREMGVTPMALYHHVADHQAVLDDVADRVLAELALPDDAGPWRDRVETVFVRLRSVYLRHPRALPLIQGSTRASREALAPMELVLRAFADAGLPREIALATWAALVGLTDGFVGYEAAGHLRPAGAEAVDRERFPHVHDAVGNPAVDWDGAFVGAVRGLLSALAAEHDPGATAQDLPRGRRGKTQASMEGR